MQTALRGSPFFLSPFSGYALVTFETKGFKDKKSQVKSKGSLRRNKLRGGTGPWAAGRKGWDAVVCCVLSSFLQISSSPAASQGLQPLLSPFAYSTPQWGVYPRVDFKKNIYILINFDFSLHCISFICH